MAYTDDWESLMNGVFGAGGRVKFGSGAAQPDTKAKTGGLPDLNAALLEQQKQLDELLKKKPRVVVLTKADLADADQTKQWIAHFRNMGIYAFACNSKSGEGCNRLRAELNTVLREKLQRRSGSGVDSSLISSQR